MNYAAHLKTPLDFIVSLTLLIILSPIFLTLILIISLSLRQNPFFIQKRAGLNEKIFKILKFKTMTNERDLSGNLLPDHMRLNKIGRIVRKTSLDEIPQLINVLKGEMSIVGPRPLLVSYLELYSEEQKKRHLVKPGITGWVGVNGRNAISWQEKFKLDVWYVNHQNFFLDIKILWLTVKKVLLSDGISAEGQATTKKFEGN